MSRSSRRRSSKAGWIVPAVIALVAVIVLLNGWAFQILWNNFVVEHLHGATRTSYGHALFAALLIGGLVGGAVKGGSR